VITDNCNLGKLRGVFQFICPKEKYALYKKKWYNNIKLNEELVSKLLIIKIKLKKSKFHSRESKPGIQITLNLPGVLLWISCYTSASYLFIYIVE
jgi:hypothetical protein